MKTKALCLFLALSYLLSSCHKETTEWGQYFFKYNYSNYCGGEYWITIPNSFCPGQTYYYNNQWELTLSGRYYGNDSCRNAIPMYYKNTGYFNELVIEVKDKAGRLMYRSDWKYIPEGSTWPRQYPWDGNILNSKVPAPAGQYYWSFRFVGWDNAVHQEQGCLHLLR